MGAADHEGRYLPEPVRRPRADPPAADDAVEALRAALAVAIGAAGLIASTLADAIAAAAPQAGVAARRNGVVGMAATLSTAGLEAGAGAAVGAARLGRRMASGMGRVAGAAPRPGFVQSRIDAARTSTAAWQARVDAAQRDRERAAGQALGRAVGRVVEAIDVDAILRHVDLTAVVERVDVNRLLDTIDVDQVLAKVDVDKLLDRVDLNAVVNKLDLGGITQDVLQEIDFQEIVRSSTEGVSAEVVGTVRSQAVRGDTFVARVVDRLLLRRSPRELDAPAPVEPEDDDDDEREERR